MLPRMTTRSAGRAAVAPLGRRTGRRTGRGGGRTRGRSNDQGNGNHSSNLGNLRNQIGDAVNDNIQGDVRNVIVNNNRMGCTYKKFLACNPKEYDGKGDSMSWLATEPTTIQKAVQIASTLTDETLRNGSIKRTLRREEIEENLARIGMNPASPWSMRVIGGRRTKLPTRRRAFMLGAEEARDPNIVTGMDWLSNHKAKIISHEKVVRIPLLDGKVLRVLGERPKEKARHLTSPKAKEQKMEEMIMVRDC
ncbi:hypothetical protein Tco_0848236 [Tanacetum coccineum]